MKQSLFNVETLSEMFREHLTKLSKDSGQLGSKSLGLLNSKTLEQGLGLKELKYKQSDIFSLLALARKVSYIVKSIKLI